MTFREYLSIRRVTDTPQGDFTTDARRDSNMPNAETWAELKSYMERRSGDVDVIKAAHIVWQGYVKANRINVGAG